MRVMNPPGTAADTGCRSDRYVWHGAWEEADVHVKTYMGNTCARNDADVAANEGIERSEYAEKLALDGQCDKNKNQSYKVCITMMTDRNASDLRSC